MGRKKMVPYNNTTALSGFAAALNVELFFNDEGVCDLVVDHDALVTLEGDPLGSTLRINGVVGCLPDERSGHALRTLLHANFNAQGTGNSSLGLDHVTGEVVLGRSVDVSTLGHAGLEPVIAEFVRHLDYWRKNLEQLVTEEAIGEAATMLQAFSASTLA